MKFVLVTSIFCFFHNVFKSLLSQGSQKLVLCGKVLKLNMYTSFQVMRMTLNLALLGLMHVLCTVLADQDVSDRFGLRLTKLEDKVEKEVQGLKQKTSILEGELEQVRRQSHTSLKRLVGLMFHDY